MLRRKPPGRLLKSAHMIEREFRVLKALEGTGFPSPRPLALCEDEGVIGTAFYVMAFVDGRIFWDRGADAGAPAHGLERPLGLADRAQQWWTRPGAGGPAEIAANICSAMSGQGAKEVQ